jgi:hypothetical protein
MKAAESVLPKVAAPAQADFAERVLTSTGRNPM